MSIVSSTLVASAPQTSGRYWCEETHVDQLGIKYLFRYLAEAALDVNAVMAARAAQVWSDLVAGEIASNIMQVTSLGSLAVPKFAYSTVAANVAALRAAYLIATQTQAVMIGDYLSSRTDAQLQTAFGMTAGQVTTLRTNKLTPAASAAATIRASTGQ